MGILHIEVDAVVGVGLPLRGECGKSGFLHHKRDAVGIGCQVAYKELVDAFLCDEQILWNDHITATQAGEPITLGKTANFNGTFFGVGNLINAFW